jgi:phosphohistidine phosphatase
MLRLILIRHAKSAWGADGQEDHERQLAPRGVKASRWIADTLRAESWLPDLVLCSTAVRTRQTLEISGIDAPTRFVRDIYDRMSGDFVDIIRRMGGEAATLALIGHNTGMETTARLLAEDGADFGGYPTGAIAVMDFAIERWSELEAGTGRIVAFRRPREG